MKKLSTLLSLLLLNTLISACSPFSDEKFFEPVITDKYVLSQSNEDTGFQLDFNFRLDNALINHINLDSNDGNSTASIAGIYVGDIDSIDVDTVIVYAHDKMKNIDFYWPRIQSLAKIGLDKYGILIMDYRGYGASAGKPSESGLYADVNAAIVWLKEKGLTSDRLILYGYGLGAALVIELAANPRSLSPTKIILESPFASIESLIQETTLQSTPRSYVSQLSFNNVEKIKNITQPILWLHGTDDHIYNIDTQGQLLFNRHPGIELEDKTSMRVQGATHFDVPLKFEGGLEAYTLKVLIFISSS